MTTLAEIQQITEPHWEDGAEGAYVSPGGVYYSPDKSWGVLKGKVYNFSGDGSQIPEDVKAAYPIASPQEVQLATDPKFNQAGAGSMKEGLTQAALFALTAGTAGGAGSGLEAGAGGAFDMGGTAGALGEGASGAGSSVTDSLSRFFSPTASASVTDVPVQDIPWTGPEVEPPAASGPPPGVDYADWLAQDSSAITPAQATEAGVTMAPNSVYPPIVPVTGAGAAPKTIPGAPPLDKDASSIPDAVKTAAGAIGTGLATAAGSAIIGSALSNGASGDGGLSAAADAQTAEEARKAGLRKKINQLYGIDDGTDDPVAKAARDSMAGEETKLGDSTRSFYDEQLQHDTEKAFRNNRFTLADRGTLGGSAQIDTEKELSRDNTLGATRVADQVANAVAGLKSSREQERLNATNLVNTGSGEDAVQSAQAGLTRSLSNANAQQHASITGDLFSGGADSVAAANSGYNPLLLAQYQNRLSSFFNPGGGGSGRTTAT